MLPIDESVKKLNGRNLSKIKFSILRLRFPFYRNMEPNSKIEFTFPLTVFIGKNGAGKSSALQALYGCPYNMTLRDHWFSTVIDPISGGSTKQDEKQRIIYAYVDDNGKTVECIKARAGTGTADRKGEDYWEPVKPTIRDQVASAERVSPVKKSVIYHDFRHHLSAFEVSFHVFGRPSPLVRKYDSKQDYIRKKASDLNDAIRAKKGTIRALPLDRSTLDVLGYILGKSYSEGKIIEHGFYSPYSENKHFTVMLRSSNVTYSEAGAGSGETSMAILLNRLAQCESGSLILLDEPEISLHPGAQKRLLQYLLNICVDKQLQVVISTHSPEFVRPLPSSAIRLFQTNRNERFIVADGIDPWLAFLESEVPLGKKAYLRVEDKSAKMLLEKVIGRLGREFESALSVNHFEGGASVMWSETYYAARTATEQHLFFVFDGDQQLIAEDELEKSAGQTDSRPRALAGLEQLVGQRTKNNKISWMLNSGYTSEDKKEYLNNYLDYIENHVSYLPCLLPEDIVWDGQRLLQILTSMKPDVDRRLVLEICDRPIDGKHKLEAIVTEIFANDTNKYHTLYDSLLERWVNEPSPQHWEALANIVKNAYEKSPGLAK